MVHATKGSNKRIFSERESSLIRESRQQGQEHDGDSDGDDNRIKIERWYDRLRPQQANDITKNDGEVTEMTATITTIQRR